MYDLLHVSPFLSLHKEPYWWSRPLPEQYKNSLLPRGQVQWLVPSLLIHAHSVFPSPHVKLEAWSQESPVWTKARLPGKGPFLHITSICKLRRQKKRCLTHEGDRRNNGKRAFEDERVVRDANYSLYQPRSLCILSCHRALLCASQM